MISRKTVMSLLSLVSRSTVSSLWNTVPSRLFAPKLADNWIVATEVPSIIGGVSMLLGSVRGKKKKMGGSTRNKCGDPPGQKRGLKIYDGQRVPVGKVLVDQRIPYVMPGWNVSDISFVNGS